jgi:hypothetical protein
MTHRHSNVHANNFEMFDKTDVQAASCTVLSFGIHRLCEFATDLLYRKTQGGCCYSFCHVAALHGAFYWHTAIACESESFESCLHQACLKM